MLTHPSPSPSPSPMGRDAAFKIAQTVPGAKMERFGVGKGGEEINAGLEKNGKNNLTSPSYRRQDGS